MLFLFSAYKYFQNIFVYLFFSLAFCKVFCCSVFLRTISCLEFSVWLGELSFNFSFVQKVALWFCVVMLLCFLLLHAYVMVVNGG